jgi:hypothetical protein
MTTPLTPLPFSGLSNELTETERQVDEDYDWAQREPGLRPQYVGLFVAVHRKTVWGSGKTIGDAVREALAKPGCPTRQELAKVYIE